MNSRGYTAAKATECVDFLQGVTGLSESGRRECRLKLDLDQLTQMVG
jgi:hypothetical protein